MAEDEVEDEEAADSISSRIELVWKKPPTVEVRNRRVTDEIRLNMILREMRNQLEMHDLVEVMIDLHTGKPSKKTRMLIENSYDVVKMKK